MKLSTLILLLLIFSSCNQNTSIVDEQEVKIVDSIKEVTIPNIEKNINDANFKLDNGVQLFNGIPYSGIIIEFYKDGVLKSKSQYFEGRREGFYNGWYFSGNIKFERTYSNGLKTSIHKGWYDTKAQKFEYYFNNVGAYNGSVKEWYSNGTLAKHFNFEKGKENGSQKMWNPNGNIRANFFTVNGERHGLIGLKNCVSIMTSS